MTPEVAIVAPLEIHKRLDAAGILGKYQLLLAHEVLAQPEEYSRFWRAQKDQVIIMDNSLIELGKPLPMEAILEAGELTRAQIVVLPDVLGDRIKTYELFSKAWETLEALKNTNEYAMKVRTLGVAQGHSHVDVFSCGRDMIRAGATMISVPRHIADTMRSRYLPTSMLARYGIPMHLLGFSNHLFDDFLCTAIKGVAGIDSALPVWYGLKGQILPKVPPEAINYGRRPEEYSKFKTITPEVIENVRRVREWGNIVRPALTEMSATR